MKRVGLLLIFFVFLTVISISSQEHEIESGAVCQVFMGSSSTDGELYVEFGSISSDGSLTINVRNRIRNADVEITSVEVEGNTSGGRTITEKFRRNRELRFSRDFIERILPRSKSGTIRVKLDNIKKVSEVTIYADICEL
jgi:hypothetical protein